MSTNVHLQGTRQVTVNKTGKNSIQTISVGLLQTPSNISRTIIQSDDPKQVYFDWVMSISKDEVENVFAEDDIFEERAPISTKVYNIGKVHIKDVEEWISQNEEEGYSITWEAW